MVDHITTAARDALTLIQDYVSEQCGHPGRTTFHRVLLPGVQVKAQGVRMWFEDPQGNILLAAPVVKW